MTTKLEPRFIEHIHDVLVGAFLPFDEKINPAEYRSRASIESAVSRPFQTAFETELYPTLVSKAAALFHSLVCNHCFINGNKRTAVIGLDLFLAINMHLLVMTSEEIYEMAKATATANQEGRSPDAVVADLAERIGRSTLDIEIFKDESVKEKLGDEYEKIITHVARIMTFGQKIMEFDSSESPPDESLQAK